MHVDSRGLRRLLRVGRVRLLRALNPPPSEPRPSAWRAAVAPPLALPDGACVPDSIYEWRPGTYPVGVRVEWETITLVCCMAHATVYGAEHPWAVPGYSDTGMAKLAQQACLWAPDGDVEAARLKRLVIDGREELDDRLRALCLMAAGEAKAA